MKKWFTTETPMFHTKLVKTVKLYKVIQQEIIEQTSIKWDHFIIGRITKTRTHLQTLYKTKEASNTRAKLSIKNTKNKRHHLGGIKFYNI